MTDISAVVQLQETVLQATLGSPNPGGGTDVTLGASVDDVLSLAGQQLNADGPAGDVLLFWDASAGKLTHLSLAPGLSITGTVLSVTAGGTGTVTSVNITQPAAGITASGGPITSSGSITLALADDLAAVEGLSTTGIVRRTGANTWSAGTQVNLASEVTGQLPYSSLSGAPNLALKADLVGGVVPTSQIPSVALVQFLGAVGSQVAMLALRGEPGDWAIRTDRATEWVIVANNGATLSDWYEMPTGIAPVGSVNGQTGSVVLGTGNLSETGGNLFFTAARAIGSALTGFTAGAGVVAATDTILQAIQKIVGNLAGRALTGAIGSSGLTMATARLLGRSTAGTGGPEEITIGSGLDLTAGVLTAPGGSAAGTTGQVQYRSSGGAFAGASDLVIDPTSGRLTLAGFLASEVPEVPASGFTLYAATGSNALSWKGANGFTRTFDGTANTADRAYTLQNKTGTIAHRDDITAQNAGAQPLTLSISTIAYAVSVNLDLAALAGLYRRIDLTGPLTLTTSNLAPGRSVVLILACDSTTRALTVPAGWRWANKPTQIAASKWAVLSLTFAGTTDSDCIAAWWAQS